MSAFLFVLASALLAQAPTELVSVSLTGGVGNGDSSDSSLSADGRFVAFASGAPDLVHQDLDLQTDVFVRDRWTGTTELISVTPFHGGSPRRGSFSPDISDDGRFVAFASASGHLVPGDDTGRIDIFVRDRALGITERVSVATDGTPGDQNSYSPSISADGQRVVFVSTATNFAPGAQPPNYQVYVHDRGNGTTSLVSAMPSGSAPNSVSAWASISSDGRFVAFQSYFPFVPQDTDQLEHVYVRDLASGAFELVSVSSSEAIANDTSRSPSISADGRFVAFSSLGDNLVSGDTNGPGAIGVDIFVRDRLTGTTRRASEGKNGEQANSASYASELSGDGLSIVFTSYATNLVPVTGGFTHRLFWKDLLTGDLEWTSASYDGSPPTIFHGWTFDLTFDGRTAAFCSPEGAIVPGDGNGAFDVFVRATPPISTAAYCTAKVNSQGCLPGLVWSGTPSASASTFVVVGNALLNQKLGLHLWGRTPQMISALGLCVAPPVVRTPVASTGGSTSGVDCSGSLAFAWASAYLLAIGAQPGDTLYTQVWSRDPAAASGTSTTQGLRFVVVP